MLAKRHSPVKRCSWRILLITSGVYVRSMRIWLGPRKICVIIIFASFFKITSNKTEEHKNKILVIEHRKCTIGNQCIGDNDTATQTRISGDIGCSLLVPGDKCEREYTIELLFCNPKTKYDVQSIGTSLISTSCLTGELTSMKIRICSVIL